MQIVHGIVIAGYVKGKGLLFPRLVAGAGGMESVHRTSPVPKSIDCASYGLAAPEG